MDAKALQDAAKEVAETLVRESVPLDSDISEAVYAHFWELWP